MWEKMKKSKALVLAGALLGSVLLSTEASAAAKITTGTSCTTKQKNKTTKVTASGITDTYKCTTNPTSKGAAAKKLVWVTLDCLNTNAEIKSTAALIARQRRRFLFELNRRWKALDNPQIKRHWSKITV